MADRRKQIDESIIAISECIDSNDEKLAALVALGLLSGMLKDLARIADSLEKIANKG